MPYIPPDILAKIKQIDLYTYLKTYTPSELVRISGNVYRMRSHESLKISNGRWMWWSRGIGGRSALDYLIKVEGYSFLEAAELIMSQASLQPPEILPAEKTKEKILLLPEPYAFRPGDCMRAGIITTLYLWGRTAVARRDMLPCAASDPTLSARQLEVIRTILFVSRQRKPAGASTCLSQPLIFCLTLPCARWMERIGEQITCCHWREYTSPRKRLRKVRFRQPYPGS